MKLFASSLGNKKVVVPPPIVYGCTDPLADNYNPLATQDDGSCTYTNPQPTRNFNVIQGGQSIPHGNFAFDAHDYTPEKYANGHSYFWYNGGWSFTFPPILKPFAKTMMSYYQWRPDDQLDWGCGPEFTMAELIHQHTGRGINLYKPCHGGTGFGTDENPDLFYISADGSIKMRDATHICDNLQYLHSTGVEWDFMIWYHGESDGVNSLESRAAYETNLRNFITNVRIKSGNPNLPVILRKLLRASDPWMDYWFPDAVPNGVDAINMATENVMNTMSNVYRIEHIAPFTALDGTIVNVFPMADNIHPDALYGTDIVAIDTVNLLIANNII